MAIHAYGPWRQKSPTGYRSSEAKATHEKIKLVDAALGAMNAGHFERARAIIEEIRAFGGEQGGGND